MRTHATSCIGETGLKIFNGFPIFLNGFPIFLNGFPIFLNGFPIFLNGFPLSKKSKKIYLRRQVYKRSPFELRISCHLLPKLCNRHSLPELCNRHLLPELRNCHSLPELTKYSYSEYFMNNACISPNSQARQKYSCTVWSINSLRHSPPRMKNHGLNEEKTL